MTGSITVRVTAIKGSAPREPGAAMQIWADRQTGSIGGGALEWQATALARDMLRDGAETAERRMTLGPDLGQCCGGVVDLSFTRVTAAPDHRQPPLWIWGAGHVGRAIATTMAPLQDRAITLIDTQPNRLPGTLPETVAPMIAADMPRAVPHAPSHADHLILTYSHEIDLQLCDALLRHGFGSAGLIGSATKWARFRKRLSALGHDPSRITCPIGDPALGKHPQAIAISTATALLTAKHTDAQI